MTVTGLHSHCASGNSALASILPSLYPTCLGCQFFLGLSLGVCCYAILPSTCETSCHGDYSLQHASSLLRFLSPLALSFVWKLQSWFWEVWYDLIICLMVSSLHEVKIAAPMPSRWIHEKRAPLISRYLRHPLKPALYVLLTNLYQWGNSWWNKERGLELMLALFCGNSNWSV